MLWKILKKITCNSSCTSDCKYNNQEFRQEILQYKLSDFKLKNKDIEKIIKILSKREIKNIDNNISNV